MSKDFPLLTILGLILVKYLKFSHLESIEDIRLKESQVFYLVR